MLATPGLQLSQACQLTSLRRRDMGTGQKEKAADGESSGERICLAASTSAEV